MGRFWDIRVVALTVFGVISAAAAEATVDEGQAYSETREWSELWNLISGRQWGDALKRLDDHPEEASTLVVRKKGGRRFGPVEVKNLPLHQLFAIDVLDAGSASSLQTMQTMQTAQAHLAGVLIELNPAAASVPDHINRLPLHVAAYSSVPPTTVLLEALIAAYPKAATISDDDRRLPLHASTYQPLSSFTTVQRILNAYPEAIFSEAKDGSLPIHLASWAGGLHHSKEDDDATQIIRLLHSYSTEAKETLRRVDADDDSVLQIMVKYARTSEGALGYVLEVDHSAVLELHDFRGNTPLHSALSIVRVGQSAISTLPVETVVSLILNASPTAVETVNTLNQLPLHVALQQCCVDTAVVRLLNSREGIASRKDAAGNIPLHYACRDGVEDPAVVRDLLESFPEGAITTSADGQLPLHLALTAPARGYKQKSPPISVGPMDSVALNLLELYPNTAQTVDQKTRRWPLHLALAKRSSHSLVEALVRENAAAVREKIRHEGNLITVFHQIALVANDYELSALRSVTGLLMDTWPSGAQEEDSNGRLPHHTLLLASSLRDQKQGTYGRSGNNDEGGNAEATHMTMRSRRSAFLYLMLSIHPDGARTRDENGEIPLHHACRVGDISSVLLLMKAYPDGAKVRRKALDGDEEIEGRLPLHVVMSELSSHQAIDPLGPPAHGKPSVLDSIVMTLLEAYPEAAAVPDPEDKGRFPLHQMCSSSTATQYLSPDALSLLHKSYPDALKTKDEGGNSPLSLVLAEITSSNTLLARKMIDLYPGAVSERVSGNLPIHLALSFSSGSVPPSDDSMALFNVLLHIHPDAAKEVDGIGRLPIHQVARLIGESVVASTDATTSWGNLMLRLMEMNAGGMRKVDKHGRTPLHIFCLHYGDAVVVESDRTQSTMPRDRHLDHLIRRMLAAFPGAMKVVDSKEKKPIDMLGDDRITTLTGRDVGPRSVSFSYLKKMVARGSTFWGLVQQVDQITSHLAREQTKEEGGRKCDFLAIRIKRFEVALRSTIAGEEKKKGSVPTGEVDASEAVGPIDVALHECDKLNDEGYCAICAEERKGLFRLWSDLNKLGSLTDVSSVSSPANGNGPSSSSSSSSSANSKSQAQTKRNNSESRKGLADEL